MIHRWKDFLPGCVLLVIIAALYAVTTTFQTVPASFAQGMQASTMPQLILGLMALLTLVMMYQGRHQREQEKPPLSWYLWATVGVLLVSALLFDVLGLTLTTALTCFLIPLLWGERRFVMLTLYALVTPLVIYVLFTYALQLRLPQGILSPWLA